MSFCKTNLMGQVHRIVERKDGQIRFALVTQEYAVFNGKDQLIKETHYVRIDPALLEGPIQQGAMYWVEGRLRTAKLGEPEYRGFENTFTQASRMSLL